MKAPSENIILYGVPGAGKTYVSKQFQKETGFELIELDSLRKIAQREDTSKENPFYFYGTTEAFQHFGCPTNTNIIKGLKGVRDAMQPFIKDKLVSYKANYVAEGAFIDPEFAKSVGRTILITKTDLKQHKKQYFTHRKETSDVKKHFEIARILQDFLIEEAKTIGIEILEA